MSSNECLSSQFLGGSSLGVPWWEFLGGRLCSTQQRSQQRSRCGWQRPQVPVSKRGPRGPGLAQPVLQKRPHCGCGICVQCRSASRSTGAVCAGGGGGSSRSGVGSNQAAHGGWAGRPLQLASATYNN